MRKYPFSFPLCRQFIQITLVCTFVPSGGRSPDTRTFSGAAQSGSAEAICGQNFTVIPVEVQEPIDLPAAFWRLKAGWIASVWKINVGLIDENKHMWQLR